MSDAEVLRESERWLEELRCYRIAADDPGRFDAILDAALLAVREKLARLAAPAPDGTRYFRELGRRVVEISREQYEHMKLHQDNDLRVWSQPAVAFDIEALRPYLQHFEECNALVREDERAECDCGLDELMREAFGEVTP